MTKKEGTGRGMERNGRQLKGKEQKGGRKVQGGEEAEVKEGGEEWE